MTTYDQMSQTIVAVVGANGELGQLVVESLLARAAMDKKNVLVKCLVRRESNNLKELSIKNAGKVGQVIVDFSNKRELEAAFKGVYCVGLS